ncbi:MAG: hypothetical protein LJF06_04370 [Gemmatimonadetes bacterium]|nr:hypothetical protein [Gemmatimonadota bacterium]
MPQRDYILRLIEEMGAIMAALRDRILGRKTDHASLQDELTALSGRAGFDLALLRGFDGETLRMLVAPTGEVEPARCWMMAEILYLDGLEADVDDRRDDARASLDKARILYSLIEPAGGMLVGIVEAAARIEEIDRRLATLPEG